MLFILNIEFYAKQDSFLVPECDFDGFNGWIVYAICIALSLRFPSHASAELPIMLKTH